MCASNGLAGTKYVVQMKDIEITLIVKLQKDDNARNRSVTAYLDSWRALLLVLVSYSSLLYVARAGIKMDFHLQFVITKWTKYLQWVTVQVYK